MNDKRGKSLDRFIEEVYEPGKKFTERWAQRLYRRLLKRYLQNEQFIESCRLNGVTPDEVAREAVKTEIERRQAERLRRQKEEHRHLIFRLTRKAIAEFREFWSGDPRLPYQGWFGKLAKHQPGVAYALIASLSGNAAWLVFSIRNKWFRAPAKQFVDEFLKGQPHAHSTVYTLLTMIAWGCAVFAMLFAAILLVGVVGGGVLWLRDNLRSGRTHGPGKGK